MIPATTLADRYCDDLQRSGMRSEPAQLEALKKFQRLLDQLESAERSTRSPVFRWSGRNRSQPPKGIYFWGGVGRGKTYLMDLFYDAVPISAKIRIHFHRFMQSVHGELKGKRNTRDPLAQIGKEFAKRYRLLCLDEFFVLDIGDAVILAGLLKALIGNGVTLVMTSNTEPNALYAGGLQRDRFIAAIQMINLHTEVLYIEDGTDYRLRTLTGKTLYHHPSGPDADRALEENFRLLYGDGSRHSGDLEILGRPICTLRYTEHLAWFEFFDICDGPRSKADYIEIANLYRTIMISNIPVLTWEYENQARRFIELVDEFYDHGVHLIVSAECGIDSLYAGTRLVREFERTASRLHEMQTDSYLSRTHCA